MSKYQVTVTSVPDNLVALVKSLRLVADLGLKDAKDLADYLGNPARTVASSWLASDKASPIISPRSSARQAARPKLRNRPSRLRCSCVPKPMRSTHGIGSADHADGLANRPRLARC